MGDSPYRREDRYNRLANERSPSVSRSRSRGRSRSRTRNKSRERSPPREKPASIRDLLNEQQEYLHELIVQHKEEVEEIVCAKVRNFRNKGIEKQFTFNEKVLSDLKKIKKLYKKKRHIGDKLKEIVKLLEDHAEELLVADSSRHGWLTVHQLRGNQNLSSELLKKVDKIDNRLDKQKPQNDRTRRGSGYPSKVDQKDGSFTYRKKKGPGELLQELVTRKREGTCSHCSEIGHFYRECPEFWKEVSEARKKSAP